MRTRRVQSQDIGWCPCAAQPRSIGRLNPVEDNEQVDPRLATLAMLDELRHSLA
ncbi:MAG TPA: hypothetical protein VE673_05835 [Pseudonocardiaceae bacterium]|nr:hypothetical protein [Pseudonocardiaceae bacterium]